MIEDLLSIVPEEKSIRVYSEKIKLLRKANPNKIFEGFLYYVYPYKKMIENKDEKFFLNNSEEMVKKETKDEQSLTQALNMANLWKTRLNNQNKDVMWTYFRVLIILCERIVLEKTG